MFEGPPKRCRWFFLLDIRVGHVQSTGSGIHTQSSLRLVAIQEIACHGVESTVGFFTFVNHLLQHILNIAGFQNDVLDGALRERKKKRG